MKTRIFSMLLAVVLLFTSVDIAVFAEEIKDENGVESVSENEIRLEEEIIYTEESMEEPEQVTEGVPAEEEEESNIENEEIVETEELIAETVSGNEIIEDETVDDSITTELYEYAMQNYISFNEVAASLEEETFNLTEEQLFLQCPQYLKANMMHEYLSDCVSYSVDAMNEVSETDDFWAALIYGLEEGASFISQEIAARCGVSDSTYTEYKKEMACEVIREYMGKEAHLNDIVEDVDKNFSHVKRFYDLESDVIKEEYLEQLQNASNKMTDEQLKSTVDKLFEESDNWIKYSNELINAFDIITAVIEMQELELTVVEDLMISLEDSYDTDLYDGLWMIYDDITSDIPAYIMKNYLNDEAVKYITKMVTDLVEGNISNALLVVDIAMVVVEGIYDEYNPSVSEIMNASIMYNNFRTMETAVNKHKSKFLKGEVTEEDIAYYKAALKGEFCTIKLLMKHAAKLTDDKKLKALLKVRSDSMGESVTYDMYIKLCLREASNAIDNGTLVLVDNGSIDKTEDGTVLDDTYDSTESIKAKLNVIMQKYVPDIKQTWTGEYQKTSQCFGFVRMIFNLLYGNDMPASYHGNKRYEYTTNNNVALIGQLEGDEVTASNIEQMFSNAHIGDVIQGYGAPYGQHTMMLLGVTDEGIRTYECNYNNDCWIYTSTYSWSKLENRYGTGDSTSNNGMSLYHANNYEKIYGNGDDLFFDDSVNFVISDGVLIKYNGWQSFVTIPDTVTAIGDNAFKNNTSMMTVSIPDSVTSIGDYAFYGCSNLLGVVIPDSVETIGEYAFADCYRIAAVSLPENEKYMVISARCFQNDIKLKAITVPDSVTEIEICAFNGCSKLTRVDLSDNLITLGGNVFKNCSQLSYIEIPKSLTTAKLDWISSGEEGVFFGCEKLINASFEEGTTYIADNVFYNAQKLETVTIPETVTTIGNKSFYGCKSIKDIGIPESVVSISSRAFYNCTGLEKVTIPDGVTTLGFGAFCGCANLENVKLSNNLKIMGGNTFKNCVSLTAIEIPKSLTTAKRDWEISGEEGEFFGCGNLQDIKFELGTTQIVTSLFYNLSNLETIELPSSISVIGDYAFTNCSNITKITIPSGVTSIGNSTFEGCKELVEIDFSDNLSTIGKRAFSGCTSLREVHLPDSITQMGFGVFINCSNLEEVTLSHNLSKLSGNTFKNCSKLNTIEIPKSLTTASLSWESSTQKGEFYGCTSLENIIFEDGISRIATNLFYNVSSLKKITVPNTVSTINNYAFAYCSNLTEITIPRSVTNIGTGVFTYPEKMTIYGIPGSYAETYANANGITFVSNEKPIESISFENDECTINKDKWTRLPSVIVPSDYTDEICWTSDDETIVSVNEYGYVYGNQLGTTTITATSGNISASCTVTVLQPVTSISIADVETELNAGETVTLTAQVLPRNASNPSVAWQSSDEEVASVSGEGVVTAKKKGTVTIEAIALDGSNVSAKIELVVKNNLYSANTSDELQSSHPYSNDSNDIWQYVDEGKRVLWVTFTEDTCIDESDSLLLYDGEFNLLGEYSGDDLAEKTVRVYGDTVKVQLVSDGIGTAYGFAVKKIETNEDIQLPIIQEEERGVLDEDIPEGGIESVPEGLWIAGVNAEGYEYTGTAVRPEVRIYHGTTRLKEKEDYTISYKNNIRVNDVSEKRNAPCIIVKGKGSYSGQINCNFSIVPKNIADDEILTQEITVKYNGKIQKKIPSVTWNGKKLRNKLDYIIEYPDFETKEDAYKEPGTYSILIKGIGNYIGGKEVSITITENELISKTYVSRIANQNYTGKAILPDLSIRHGLNKLEEGKDYTVVYKDNIQVGTATAIITGKGKYSGEKSVTFEIVGKQLSKVSVQRMPSVFVYTGEKIVLHDNGPVLITTNDNVQTVLTEGSHYSVGYKNNVNKGIAIVTFDGINEYSGRLTKTFRIEPYDIVEDSSEMMTIYLSEDEFEYTKGGTCPKPIVLFGTTLLAEGKDYTLSYRNYKNVSGKDGDSVLPTVVINGCGNFSGNVEIVYRIKNSDIAGLEMSAGDKMFGDKAGTFQSEPTITTESGTKLKKGKDYHETLTYCYKEDTILENGVERKAGDLVEEDDIVPNGTSIKVIAIGKGNYEGTINCEYRVVKYDIGKASVDIPKKTYTGSAITLTSEDITVTFGNEELVLGEDFEIVSYSDNVDRGRAKVTIRGLGDYGGTKTVRFTIKSKLLEWWEGVIEKLFS